MAQKSKSSKAKSSKAGRSKAKAKKAPVKKAPAKKAPAKKVTPKKAPAKKASSPKATAPGVPKELQLRLMSLAQQMDKSLDALMLQALCEFADAWEDHYRNIDAMVEEDDRIQLVVKPE